jgi:glycosyltransferase involved in cell wall biosynthesis
LLERTLDALSHQKTADQFTYSVIVADNDRARSAEAIVASFSKGEIPTTYAVEPDQNIAAARNKALENATGDFVAFIDDDEFPGEDWLMNMLATCEKHRASGVLGPVLPFFDRQPPNWLIRGRFCERPRYKTGTALPWRETRTGNVLFRRALLKGIQEPFSRHFGSGGEDQEFFKRMMEKGAVFIWCDEGPVHEVVPPERWRRRYLLRRALLRGQNEKGLADLRGIGRSLVAVPLYMLSLPFLFIIGQHLFMKYLVKSLDHAGKLLAVTGFKPLENKYSTQ